MSLIVKMLWSEARMRQPWRSAKTRRTNDRELMEESGDG
jgi:hypothetical protein